MPFAKSSDCFTQVIRNTYSISIPLYSGVDEQEIRQYCAAIEKKSTMFYFTLDSRYIYIYIYIDAIAIAVSGPQVPPFGVCVCVCAAAQTTTTLGKTSFIMPGVHGGSFWRGVVVADGKRMSRRKSSAHVAPKARDSSACEGSRELAWYVS